MKIYLFLTIAFIIALSSCYAQNGWNIPYGQSADEVGIFNSNTDPDFSEDMPFGPMSFRIHNQKLWLLDSIGAGIKVFNKEGLVNNLKFKNMPENHLLEDFAIVTDDNNRIESVWVAEAAESVIYKFSAKTGNKQHSFGSRGAHQGQFLQINQIELDNKNRLYVGDYGKSLISVFSPYGEHLFEIPWQRSGFTIDQNDMLHLIEYRENAGYFLLKYDGKKLVSSTHLGLNKLQNAKVISFDEELKGVFISFIPETGFEGRLHLYIAFENGRSEKIKQFAPQPPMNRFIQACSYNFWVAQADFNLAPEGFFKIIKLESKE